MATTSVEELSAIEQALAAIQNRLKDIKQVEDNMVLGEKFRRAAEQASDLLDVGRVGSFRRAINEAGETMKQFARQIKEATTAQVAMAGAFMGFIGGFGMAKTTLTAFGGLLKSVFNVGRSVVGAFTRTIGALFSFFYGALKSDGGGSGLYEQLQEMRRSFGGLEDYTNQAVFSIVDNLRQLPRRLEVVGYWFTKLIENARQYAETLGPLFMDFARYQFTPATALLLHGMGATEEQQVDLVRSSRAMGGSLNDMMINIARNGAAVGQAIGESAKVIQREMLAARENIEVFGGVADEQLSLAIGRLRTLGMEAQDVANIFSTFDTFQGAAEAASQLAAAFGMQVDVFRMVNEENPAARLDMLRQQLFRTGRSAEQLSRRELMLFADVLGESDHRLVQMALSAQNAGMSMEDIAKAAEESGEKTKPLEEVLSDLANQIARLVMSGGGYNTFLEAMNYGIEHGIRHWMWLNQLTFSYRRALHETAWGFRNLAMTFMSYFPGIREVTRGFVELLDPSRIREFFRTLTGSTFDYLGGVGGVANNIGGRDGLIYRFLGGESFDPIAFFEHLFDAIMQWAGPNGPVVLSLMNGLKTIGSALLSSVQGFLSWSSEKIFGDPRDGIGASIVRGFRDALRFLVNFMTPEGIGAALNQAGDFAGGFFQGFITPIVEFFKSPETQAALKEILDLLGQAAIRVFEMSDHLFRRITGAFSEALLGGFGSEDGLGPGLVSTITAMLVAPTVISMVAGVGMKLGLSILGGIKNIILGAASSVRTSLGLGSLFNSISISMPAGLNPGGTSRAMGAANQMAGATEGAASIGQSAQGASRLSPAAIFKGGAAIAAVAALVGTVGVGLVWALNKIDYQPGLIEKAGAFGILLVSMTPAIIAAGLIGMGGPATAAAVALGGVIVAAFVGIMGLITTNFIGDLNSMNISDNTVAAMRVLPGFFMSLGAVAVAVSAAALATVVPGSIRRAEAILSSVTDFMTASADKVIEIANSVSTIMSGMSSADISNLEMGLNLFTELYGVITGVIPAISELMESTRPGLFRRQRARTEAIRTTFEGLTGVFDELFGSGSVVNRLVDSTRGISLSSEDVERISVLGPVFDLVVAIATISTEYGGKMIEATRGSQRQSISLQEMREINAAVTGMSASMMSLFEAGVPAAISGVINAVRGQEIPEGGAQILEAVSGILGAVLGFIGPVSEMFVSDRARVAIEAIQNGGINRQARLAIESISDNAPNISAIAQSLGRIITEIQAPIGQLIGIVVSQAENITNVEEFADKAEAILSVVSAMTQVIELSQTLGQMSENNLRITPNGIGEFSVTNIRSIVNVIGQAINSFTSNSSLSRLGQATQKLEEINTEFMPKLQEFFENSGDVVRAIESSGVIRLENSLRAGLRELLPAAAAAIETAGAEITTDNISVALAGNTFNIEVILEIDGQELARVAAENLTGNRN